MCRRTSRPENGSENKPRFRWVTFGRSILVLAIDMILLLVIAFGVWVFCRFFLLKWGMTDRNVFTRRECVELIKALVCPVSVMITIFLFRNPILRILYELPWFIRRSRFDNSQPASKKDIQRESAKPGLGDSWNSDKNGETEGGPTKGNAKTTTTGVSNERNFEKIVAQSIQNEIWPIVLYQEATIENSKCRFDAAFEKDGFIYGIEIKIKSSTPTLITIVNRLDKLYLDFSNSIRDRFVFVLCLIGESTGDEKMIADCSTLLYDKPYHWELRVYDSDGKKINTRHGSPSWS